MRGYRKTSRAARFDADHFNVPDSGFYAGDARGSDRPKSIPDEVIGRCEARSNATNARTNLARNDENEPTPRKKGACQRGSRAIASVRTDKLGLRWGSSA
jgi:hypothetical protein